MSSKRIALLSFTKCPSFGACLQAHALYYTIKSMGHNTKYIDYHRDYKKDTVIWLFRKLFSLILCRDDSPSYSIREFIALALKRTEVRGYSSHEEHELFEEFWNLAEYTSPVKKRDLSDLNDYFDLFIVGSDQVWNCGKVNLDTTFMLDFVNGDDYRRCSYSSSFGLPSIPQKYYDTYIRLLGRFSHISLRESFGIKKTLDEVFPKKDILMMPDPVFLLTANEWANLSSDLDNIERPYILVYDLNDNDDFINETATHYASAGNLKVVRMDDINSAIGPRQWLSLIMHASLIITNSFHGTAFSLVFGIPFVSVISNMEIMRSSMSRITELLDRYGEKGRLVIQSDDSDYAAFDAQLLPNIDSIMSIDYSTINTILESDRKRGLNYLESCINESIG